MVRTVVMLHFQLSFLYLPIFQRKEPWKRLQDVFSLDCQFKGWVADYVAVIDVYFLQIMYARKNVVTAARFSEKWLDSRSQGIYNTGRFNSESKHMPQLIFSKVDEHCLEVMASLGSSSSFPTKRYLIQNTIRWPDQLSI